MEQHTDYVRYSHIRKLLAWIGIVFLLAGLVLLGFHVGYHKGEDDAQDFDSQPNFVYLPPDGTLSTTSVGQDYNFTGNTLCVMSNGEIQTDSLPSCAATVKKQ